jgi:hypothetical protein
VPVPFSADGLETALKRPPFGALPAARGMIVALPAIAVLVTAFVVSPGTSAAHDDARQSSAWEKTGRDVDAREAALGERASRSAADKATASAGAGVWRRTVDGWERTTDWRLRRGAPRPAVVPLPHPTVVAALEILISLWALLAESTYWAPRFRLGRAIASNPGSSWRKAR